jgi:hypothetical protein
MIEALGWVMLTSWGLGLAWALYVLWMSRDGREVYPTLDDEPLIRRHLKVIQGGKRE